jgi:hypothetical protein
MITIRYLGNAKSLHTIYEVLRDGKVISALRVPGCTARNLSAGSQAMAIALREFT